MKTFSFAPALSLALVAAHALVARAEPVEIPAAMLLSRIPPDTVFTAIRDLRFESEKTFLPLFGSTSAETSSAAGSACWLETSKAGVNYRYLRAGRSFAALSTVSSTLVTIYIQDTQNHISRIHCQKPQTGEMTLAYFVDHLGETLKVEFPKGFFDEKDI